VSSDYDVYKPVVSYQRFGQSSVSIFTVQIIVTTAIEHVQLGGDNK